MSWQYTSTSFRGGYSHLVPWLLRHQPILQVRNCWVRLLLKQKLVKLNFLSFHVILMSTKKKKDFLPNMEIGWFQKLLKHQQLLNSLCVLEFSLKPITAVEWWLVLLSTWWEYRINLCLSWAKFKFQLWYVLEPMIN